MLADVICYWKMTSFMALDGVTSFQRLKDVTKTRKQMRRSLSIGGSAMHIPHATKQCKIVMLYKSRFHSRLNTI